MIERQLDACRAGGARSECQETFLERVSGNVLVKKRFLTTAADPRRDALGSAIRS